MPQGIDPTFFEAILASADKTFRTVPVIIWEGYEWRIQTVLVVPKFARVTDDYVFLVLDLNYSLFSKAAGSTFAQLDRRETNPLPEIIA